MENKTTLTGLHDTAAYKTWLGQTWRHVVAIDTLHLALLLLDEAMLSADLRTHPRPRIATGQHRHHVLLDDACATLADMLQTHRLRLQRHLAAFVAANTQTPGRRPGGDVLLTGADAAQSHAALEAHAHLPYWLDCIGPDLAHTLGYARRTDPVTGVTFWQSDDLRHLKLTRHNLTCSSLSPVTATHNAPKP